MNTKTTTASDAKTYPVVVYGASGYTGQLTCENLAKLGVPFLISGRSQAKLEAVAERMRSLGGVCRAQAVEHSPPALRALFQGRQVVINISGPFSLLGAAVVDAALAAGCHYVDSTGEQDFMLDMRRDYDAHFRAAGRVLAPSTAFLWGLGSTAADVCLETPGIDTLDVVYAPPSLQTMASLQSMWRTCRRQNFCLHDGQLTPLPAAEMQRKRLSTGEKRMALRLGSGEPTFLMDDKRVKNSEVWFASNTLALVVPMFAGWHHLSRVVPGQTLDIWSDALVERFKHNPEREEPESGRFVVDVTGSGPAGTVQVTLNGTSPYLLTGFLCAMAAQTLLQREPLRTGYVSVSQALGARYVLQRLEEAGATATVRVQPMTNARSLSRPAAA